MENKQLERELRSIVQGLKGDEIERLIGVLEKEEGLLLNKNFSSKIENMKNLELTVHAALSCKIN